MARSKELRVVIAGDADKLNRELRKSGNALDKFGKQTRVSGTVTSRGFAAMRVGAVGATAAIGGLAIAGKKVVDAAVESEKSQARLRAQLKASGISYTTHAKEIDTVIQKHSQLAGLDDEDLQDAFTNIVRVTGDVDKSLRLTGLAADFARAKHMDVAKAGELVGKVAGGNIGILSRYGIQIDKGASSTEALGVLQQKFAGQAEAYGKTTGGSVDRASVAFENLQEVIGEAAAPAVADIADKTAKFVNEMSTGTGQGGRFVDTLRDIWTETKPIVMWVGRAAQNIGAFVREHPNVGKLALAVVGVGAAVKALKFASAATGFTDLLKLGRSTMRRLVTLFAAQGAAAGAASGTAAAGTEGLASKAGLIRRAGSRLGKAMIAPFAAQGAAAGLAAGSAAAGGGGLTSAATFNKTRSAGSRVGKVAGRGLVVGIIAGFAMMVPDLIKKLRDSIIGAPARFGESIGKAVGRKLGIDAGDGIGKMRIPNVMGGKAGNLMGANRALAPIAAVGTRFGLRVSSGLRPGAITSSGNVSYHGSGEAVDLAGPPAAMMRTFRALKSTVGGRLAELIYTPGGVGIKNGRPHTYTGKVAADHHNHVHAALDLGTPGPGIGRAGPYSRRGRGDGIGDAVRAGRTAGFSGSDLVTLVAIAGPESSYRNNARLVTSREDSRGMWQINTLAHPWARSMDLSNPTVAARAARRVWQQSGRSWSPWTAYTSGAYRRFIDQARSAVVGSRGSSSSRSTGTRGTGRGSRSTRDPASQITPGRHRGGTVTPGVPSYEQDLAEADVGVAQAERQRNTQAQVVAQTRRRAVVKARLNKVTAALRKKGLRPATRLRLTQERAQLLGDLGAIDTTIGELTAPPEASESGDNPFQAVIDAIEAKAEQDRQIAEEQARLAEEAAARERERIESINALTASLDANTAFANQVSAVTTREAVAMVASMISGELGPRVARRQTMPGSGSLYRL